jgi:hypothetical protein
VVWGIHDEVVLLPDRRRTLREHADDRVLEGADPNLLADRVDAELLEQGVVRVVAEDHDAAAVFDFGRREEPPEGDGYEVDLGELLRGTDHAHLRRAFTAVIDPLGRRPTVAEPRVDNVDRRRQLFDGLRVGNRQVGAPEQGCEIAAGGKADSR